LKLFTFEFMVRECVMVIIITNRDTTSEGTANKLCGILEQSMGARNRVGMGLSYRPPPRARICKHLRSPGIDSARMRIVFWAP
jgi:hypothetical protein